MALSTGETTRPGIPAETPAELEHGAQTAPRHAPRTPLAAGLLLAALGLAGCGERTEALLLQPDFPLAQRRLELASDWAFFDPTGDRARYLLAYARPGVENGARDFLLYLISPHGTGTFALTPLMAQDTAMPPSTPQVATANPAATDANGGPAAQSAPADPATPGANGASGSGGAATTLSASLPPQGFLLQLVGEFRGRTNFTGGRLRIENDRWRRGERKITFELNADGLTLRGTARPLPSTAEIAQFERRYAADVALLRPPIGAGASTTSALPAPSALPAADPQTATDESTGAPEAKVEPFAPE